MRRAGLRGALLAWYGREGRRLPWRERPTPYGTLVSEFMLQQTRVATVAPRFERFVRRFASLEALAAADVDEVLGEWQGLGYYRRARHLHQAAREASRRYGGVPSEEAHLRTLPGVGPYLAAAVASIAFGRPAAAVDGNVRRVLARLFGRDLGEAGARRAARLLLDRSRPGDWNQALMDLGAMVCTPRAPRCPSCPLAAWCRAFRQGTAGVLPSPGRRARVLHVWRPSVVCMRPARGPRSGVEVRVERMPPGGLLAGLWSFPGAEVPMAEGAGSGARASGGDPRERALAALARSLGVARRELRRLRGHDYRHVFSHRVWHVALFAAWLDPADEERGRGHVRAETEGEGARERRWATAEELRALAMPRAFEPVRELVLSGRLAPRRGGAMMEGSREAR